MCWSGEASTVLASIGMAGTAYAAYKKEPFSLWISLGYFSLMETLQAYTYTVINQCSLPSNQVATLLGYLHIAFQPFFINAVSLYFIPQDVAKRLYKPVYCVCFACTIYLILQLYPMQAPVDMKPGSKVNMPVSPYNLRMSITSGPTVPDKTGNFQLLPVVSSVRVTVLGLVRGIVLAVAAVMAYILWI